MYRFSLLCLLVSLVFSPFAQAEESPIEHLLAQLTPEQKAGQLFMVSLYGRNMTEAGTLLLQDYQPGAVSLFSYNTDYQPAGEIAKLINAMQSTAVESGIPLFIAIDHEGGRVQRIVNDVTLLPDPLAYGAVVEDYSAVEGVGAAVGRELSAIGINMNLAPVADLFTRQDIFDKNRVLYRRTFGEDPQRVGWSAAAYTRGLTEGGVIGVVKHYPGHGGAEDSHKRLPEITLEAQTALEQPLASFRVAVEQGIPAVMVGHLYYSQLEPVAGLPATLSPTLLGILRDEFGFDGLVMTDAMDMAALADNFPIPEAAVMAIQAGVDMIVMGPNVSWETQRGTIQHVIDAVRSGEISEARLDESLRRILKLKAEYNLLEWSPIDPAGITAQIDLPATQAALLAVYEDAATVVKDEQSLLPFADDPNVVIAFPAIYENLRTPCQAIAPHIEYYEYTYYPTDADFNNLIGLATKYDKIAIFVEDVHKNPAQAELAQRLPPEKTVVIALASPYDLEFFPTVSSYMALYTSLPPSHAAACHVLLGAHPALGRLPIAVGEFPVGTGLNRRQPG